MAQSSPVSQTAAAQSAAPVSQVSTSSANNSTGTPALLEGEAIFNRADQMISSAKSSVLLEMYELGSSREISLLEQKASQGIPVLVILDGTESQSIAAMGELKAHHVTVAVAHSPLINGGIEHAKMLVVDDAAVLIGGMNWGRGSYKNADCDVFLTGSSVQEAKWVFERDWALEGESIPAGVKQERATNQSILAGQILLNQLVATLDKANNIEAALFELSKRKLLATLEDRARAGASVKVLLDTRFEKPSRKVLGALKAAGVQVKLYPDNQVLHAKMLIAGNMLIVGSSNWSYDAFAKNHELDVFTSNPVLLNEAQAAFNGFWQQ